MLVRFAGEPYDEVGAERHAGDPGPDAADQGAGVALGHRPGHGAQLVLRDVLERHIYVRNDTGGARPRLDQPVAPEPRVGVLHADPTETRDSVEGL